MNRRGHGEGSIFQREDGRWVAQIDLGRHPNGKRNRKLLYGRTRQEALGKLRAADLKRSQGADLSAKTTTVRQQLEHWHETVAPTKSEATLDAYRWAIDHLTDGIGAATLEALTPSMVTRFLNAKTQAGLSPASVNKIRSVLHQALRQAEIDGLANRNAAALTDPIPLGRTSSRSMTRPQAAALLEATRTHRLGALFVVQLTMGLRPGEVAGLSWGDLDFDEGVLHVRRSLRNNSGRFELGSTKTPKSQRSLRMPQLTLRRLRIHRKLQAEERLRAGEIWEDNGLVFCSQIGTPLDPSNLRRTLIKITNEAGLGTWSPNELRHSAVSIMSAAGVPIEQIADQVGHETTRTTQVVYRHILNPVHGHATVMDDVFAEGDTA